MSFVLVSVLVGALVAIPLGWAWVALADPPSVPRGARGISYGESELNALAAVPGWYVVIGVLAGLVMGTGGALIGRRFGWIMVVAVLAGTVTAAIGTRYAGMHWFSPDVQEQLRRSHRGDPIQLDVTLGARSLLLVWPMGGFAAVVAVVGLLWPRLEAEKSPADEQAAVDSSPAVSETSGPTEPVVK
jgi:hypothetical protein